MNKDVLKYYEELKKQKMELESELGQLKEQEEFNIAKSLSVSPGAWFYKRLPLGWIDSVYCTRLKSIIPFITSTLSTFDIDNNIKNLRSRDEYRRIDYQYFALLCEAVIPSPEGVILMLRDPYRRVSSQPLCNVSKETAVDWIGHILVVKAVIYENQQNLETLEISRVKKLRLKRNSIVNKDGAERNIPSFLAEEFAFRSRVVTHEDSVIELARIKKVAKSNGWYVYGDETKDVYATFVKGEYICAFFVRDNIIEVVWDDGIKISAKDHEFMRILTNGDEGPWPEVDLHKYRALICDLPCMCVEPELEDV